MADRRLKVYNSYRSSDKKAVPELRLIAHWLEQSGFKIGEQVQVIIKDQEIIIKPAFATTYAKASVVKEASAGKPLVIGKQQCALFGN